PKKGGILNYAGGIVGSFDTQGSGFDPMTVAASTGRNYAFFYERLVAYNIATYAIEPELAQKWEQPSPTEYVFHLQPNVKWHNKPPANGRPMTAGDVLWSFQRAQTDDPRFASRSLLALVDKIETPDAATIKLTMKSADSSTFNKLASENLSVLCRDVFEKNPQYMKADQKIVKAEDVIGTGAFVMKSFEQGVLVEYARNPDYWKPGLPYLDGFRSRNFADSQSSYAAFQANQIEVTLLGGPDVKPYIDKQPSGYTPAWGADDTLGVFVYPNTKVKPMDDARVTRALRLLIDHDEFISGLALNVFGRGSYCSSFPPALSAWDLAQDEYKSKLEWKQPKDDAAKEAISLLNAAGYTKDKPLKFEVMINANPQGTTGAQLAQAQWKRLSGGIVDTTIKGETQATAASLRQAGQFTYVQAGHSVGPVDPELWLSSTYRTRGSTNFAGFSDPQLDTMIDKQRTIFDDKQRKAAVREILLYMLEHSPYTVGTGLYYFHAYQPRVQGYQPETHYLNGRLFQTVWLDQ
ncbi:MAG TPA: ABC transporter substrate-binding protein, partial [Dehalococcoidia bacterium]|nr:ABC transporter substrate-binding protein [Dehalococcoidia bacterium]